jgi:hypothetical protein
MPVTLAVTVTLPAVVPLNEKVPELELAEMVVELTADPEQLPPA